jgi:serine/threonine protein kinase
MAKPSPYRIVEKIGEGGMGVVYRAEDTRLQRDVAIKVMRIEQERELSEDKVQEIRDRFKKEAHAAARLSHPNIVAIYQVGQNEKQQYIVMEYLQGRNLLEVLDEETPLDDMVNAMIQVCDALDYAHRQGVVHRDIKPDNIVLNEEGRVKITDFGIARVDDTEIKQTRAGVLLGSPGYCAPEQLKHFRNVDGRADIFSAGVVMYQWLTGSLPFDGSTTTEVITQILTSDPEPPSGLNAQIPSSMERIILKALSKDPAERFQSGAEMKRALEIALRGLQEDQAGKPTLTQILEPSARFSLQLPMTVSALLVIGLLIYGFISIRGERGLLLKGAELRAGHMAKMLEVVGVEYSSPQSIKILDGYLSAMGREQGIVLLEVTRDGRVLSRFAAEGGMEEGDVYMKSLPLRLEDGAAGQFIVGFSKDSYNERVARSLKITIVGIVLIVVFVAGQLLYARRRRAVL